jgi:hypothetical protein
VRKTILAAIALAVLSGAAASAQKMYRPYPYEFSPSGLSFMIPPYWGPIEEGEGDFLKIVDMDGKTKAVLSPLYEIPEGADIGKNASRFLDAGLESFSALMKHENAVASVEPDGPMYEFDGLPAIDYRGSGRYGQTKEVRYRLRLVISRGKVWGIIGIAEHGEELDEGSDLDGLITSIAAVPEGN